MKKKGGLAINKPWEAYVFLAPWILGLLGFTIIPMAMSLYFSFTHYDMANPPIWIGLDNFKTMFADKRMIKSLQVTTTYVFAGLPFQLAFALLLAVILKRNHKGVRIYRAIYYLPSLLGGSVAVALLWRNIFGKEGVVNQILAVFGIVGKSWIATPSTALSMLVLLQIWQFGGSMVIFLGGLKNISTDYYEAASIDGAGKITSFFRITVPLLTPMVFFNVVMGIIGSFQAFTSSFIISGGNGSPLDTTLFYTLYLYIKAFRQFNMGYASAMAWLLLVIIAIFTKLCFMFADKWVYYDE
ncbi:MAG: sugar ABC transporter permease [Treponema sp.]|jgi:multiple sugar transport system permease protein|nr:sugar ABC transporter permease [Treponema sp.]